MRETADNDLQRVSVTQSQKPKNRKLLYATIGVVVVVAIVGVIALAALSSSNNTGQNNPPPPPVSITVVTSGTVWNLNPGHYEYIGSVALTSNSSWTISGTFTATNGITAYVMTSSEYSAWGGSGSPSSYYWTSGTNIASGSISTVLPAGTYYFVFDNTHSYSSTSVQITSNIVATASG